MCTYLSLKFSCSTPYCRWRQTLTNCEVQWSSSFKPLLSCSFLSIMHISLSTLIKFWKPWRNHSLYTALNKVRAVYRALTLFMQASPHTHPYYIAIQRCLYNTHLTRWNQQCRQVCSKWNPWGANSSTLPLISLIKINMHMQRVGTISQPILTLYLTCLSLLETYLR